MSKEEKDASGKANADVCRCIGVRAQVQNKEDMLAAASLWCLRTHRNVSSCDATDASTCHAANSASCPAAALRPPAKERRRSLRDAAYQAAWRRARKAASGSR